MSNSRSSIPPQLTLAFMLSQVGAQAAVKFAEKLKPHHLTPAHAGILRIINQEVGISQQKLAKMLWIFPSRLVLLLDDLQHKGLIERTASASDRRRSALHLTPRGQKVLQIIWRLAQEHQDNLCRSLNHKEQQILSQLLHKIAEEQGLAPGIHPGFKLLKFLKKDAC